MLVIFPFPARAALLEPDITAGKFPVSQGHPAFQAETGSFQLHILLQPVSQPRLHIHIVGLQPYFTVIQQAIVVAQIHTHLHYAMLPVQAGEIDLSFSAMALFTVQPGQLWDRQFGALAGERNKAHFAVAQIEMIELTQEEIADAVGFKPPTAVTAAQRGISQKLELIKGEVAKLPAQMQQALPDIQRQGDAFDFKIAAIFQAGIDIACIKRRAKILPARADLAHVHRYTGGGFDFCQYLRTPAVQVR